MSQSAEHRIQAERDELRLRPITVRIREACRITGIGRSKLYELIQAGEIETIKVGAVTLLPVAGIEAFLARRRAG
jgi:excisionase family DNA binding protein